MIMEESVYAGGDPQDNASAYEAAHWGQTQQLLRIITNPEERKSIVMEDKAQVLTSIYEESKQNEN